MRRICRPRPAIGRVVAVRSARSCAWPAPDLCLQQQSCHSHRQDLSDLRHQAALDVALRPPCARSIRHSARPALVPRPSRCAQAPHLTALISAALPPWRPRALRLSVHSPSRRGQGSRGPHRHADGVRVLARRRSEHRRRPRARQQALGLRRRRVHRQRCHGLIARFDLYIASIFGRSAGFWAP